MIWARPATKIRRGEGDGEVERVLEARRRGMKVYVSTWVPVRFTSYAWLKHSLRDILPARYAGSKDAPGVCQFTYIFFCWITGQECRTKKAYRHC